MDRSVRLAIARRQKRRDLSRNIFCGAPLTGFTKQELADALRQVQHMCPPRPSQQTKETLISATQQAMASQRYGTAMRDALRAVRTASAKRREGYA